MSRISVFLRNFSFNFICDLSKTNGYSNCVRNIEGISVLLKNGDAWSPAHTPKANPQEHCRPLEISHPVGNLPASLLPVAATACQGRCCCLAANVPLWIPVGGSPERHHPLVTLRLSTILIKCAYDFIRSSLIAASVILWRATKTSIVFDSHKDEFSLFRIVQVNGFFLKFSSFLLLLSVGRFQSDVEEAIFMVAKGVNCIIRL